LLHTDIFPDNGDDKIELMDCVNVEIGLVIVAELLTVFKIFVDIEACELGVKTCELGVEACKLGAETCKLGVEACKLGVEACKLGVEACKLGVETCELRVEACKFGVEACKLGVETCELRVEACKLGVEACELGVRACEVGVELCELGVEARSSGVDGDKVLLHSRPPVVTSITDGIEELFGEADNTIGISDAASQMADSSGLDNLLTFSLQDCKSTGRFVNSSLSSPESDAVRFFKTYFCVTVCCSE